MGSRSLVVWVPGVVEIEADQLNGVEGAVDVRSDEQYTEDLIECSHCGSVAIADLGRLLRKMGIFPLGRREGIG